MHELYTKLKKIGTVIRIELHTATFSDGIAVVFRRDDRLIRVSTVICGGTTYHTDWLLDHEYEPQEKGFYAKPPQNADDNIVNVLNDDCLRVIFEQDIFNIVDLAELADACPRFRVIAFQRLHALIRKPGYMKQMEHCTLEGIEKYFQVFGRRLRKIDLLNIWPMASAVSEIHSVLLLHFVSVHCPYVVHLECRFLGCTTTLYTNLMFSQLEKLHLSHSYIRLTEAEHSFEKLVRLRFTQSMAIMDGLHMPKLQEITADHTMMKSKRKFFGRNRHLKRFKISNAFDDLNSIDCASTSLKYMVDLREVMFVSRRPFYTNTHDFRECAPALKKLRKVHLAIGVPNMIRAMDAMERASAPVEYLELERVLISNHADEVIIDCICQFLNVKRLFIHQNLMSGDEYYPDTITPDQLERIVSQLSHLKHIHADSPNIDLTTIKTVLESGKKLTSAFFTIHYHHLFEAGQFRDLRGTIMQISDLADIAAQRGIQLNIEILYKVSFGFLL